MYVVPLLGQLLLFILHIPLLAGQPRYGQLPKHCPRTLRRMVLPRDISA